MRKIPLLVLSTSVAVLMLAGCATTPPPPLVCAPGFRPESMDTIYVMPVVDARMDKKLTRNLDKLQHWAAKNIKNKHYGVQVVADKNSVAGVTDDDIKDATSDWVKNLGPSEARWLMLVEVDELSRKLTFGSTGQAEVVLVVLDKQSGTVVWRDKALGRQGQGGLLGMMMVSMMDEAALESAMDQLMFKIPKKSKI
jgi:hypothetical protein